MARIQNLDVSLLDVMVALADGNPGAISAMVEMVKVAEETDPDSALGAFGPVLALDTHEIYGSDIWVLFKDICGQSAVNVLAVLRAIQLGIAPEREIKAGIASWRLPEGRVGELLAAVQARLPRFAAQVGTHPKGGDAKQAPGESLSDAVLEEDAPK